jgi:peptide/nickel transport system permease protein
LALLGYVLRRVTLLIPVIIGISTLTFIITRLIPANPIIAFLGEFARPAQVAALEQKWGLDRPLYEQYFRYMNGLAHGDLGISIHTQRPVLADLESFFPATVELSTAALLFSIVLGLPFGILSAIRRNKATDHDARVFALSGVSIPVFWLGLLLLFVIYYKLGGPGFGRIDLSIAPPTRITGLYVVDSILTSNWQALGSSLVHLVMPAFVLGYATTAVVSRMVRASMLEVLSQDYIRSARAHGLSERIVIYKHALRNAMIPVTTIIGLSYGSLLSGAVLTETIFAWPGIGLYLVNSIYALDFPSITGTSILIAMVYVAANLVVDIAYAYLDPRIRLG